jgi:hypothetical protein
VFWLVLNQRRTLAIVGATIGLVVAYFSGRIVSSWLYEVHASDPLISTEKKFAATRAPPSRSGSLSPVMLASQGVKAVMPENGVCAFRQAR